MGNAAIEEFWSWWQRNNAFYLESITAGMSGDLIDALTERVSAIDPNLAWEFGPSESAQHALCVTAGGNRNVRTMAERWLVASPPADATWQYRSTRPRAPAALDGSVEFGGHHTDIGATQVTTQIDQERMRINVNMYNPVFEKLDESGRASLMFLMLDWALGEDGVERWIGSVETSTSPPGKRSSGLRGRLSRRSEPEGSVLNLVDLAALTQSFEQQRQEDRWALLQGTDADGQGLLVRLRATLRRVDFPLYDMLTTIELPFERAADGSSDQAFDALDRFEDSMLGALGEGDFVLAAVITQPQQRSFLIYSDRMSDFTDRLGGWLEAYPEAQLATVPDPGWEQVSPFGI